MIQVLCILLCERKLQCMGSSSFYIYRHTVHKDSDVKSCFTSIDASSLSGLHFVSEHKRGKKNEMQWGPSLADTLAKPVT